MADKRYCSVEFSEITPVPCPCGMTRRAYIAESDGKTSFHVVEIKKEARRHYHKNHQEVYYILEGNGFIEADGESIPVKPGSSVLIRELCRHRAIGDLKIVNVSIPAFDAKDEWFDE